MAHRQEGAGELAGEGAGRHHVVPPARSLASGIVPRAASALGVDAGAHRRRQRREAARPEFVCLHGRAPRCWPQRPAPRSRTWTPPRRRSSGPRRTRPLRSSMPPRSAGCSMMQPSSLPARCAAAARITSSSSIRPKFGRGPDGEVWDLFTGLPPLMANCAQLLAKDHAAADPHGLCRSAPRRWPSISSCVRRCKDRGGTYQSGELAIRAGNGGNAVPTSLFTRWSS